MKIKCPSCGRRHDITAGDGRFVMPWHENYNKTAVCDASEQRYAVVGPDEAATVSFHPDRLGRIPAHADAALFALLALADGSRRRRR